VEFSTSRLGRVVHPAFFSAACSPLPPGGSSSEWAGITSKLCRKTLSKCCRLAVSLTVYAQLTRLLGLAIDPACPSAMSRSAVRRLSREL
jgi:hypothetical protein